MSASDPADTTRRFVAARQAIEAGIRTGRFRGRLPPERDLAEACGVSYMTVRRAVGDLVQAGVLRREQGRGTFVIPREGFTGRTGCLGMILAGRVYDGTVNAVYGPIFQGLVGEAERHRYAILVAHSAPDLLVDISADPAERRPHRVDGLVVGAVDDAILETVRRVREVVPVVLIDGDAAAADLPVVVGEVAAGSRAVVDHLWAQGHRRIAYIAGPQDSHSARDRLAAFRAALAARGLDLPGRHLHTGDWWYDSGMAGLRRFWSLPERPTAIACANDSMAIGVLRACVQESISVPGDLSVVGWDDIEAAALQPTALTTIHVNRTALGETACRILLDEVKAWETSGTLAQTAAEHRLETQLRVRSSTGPVRG